MELECRIGMPDVAELRLIVALPSEIMGGGGGDTMQSATLQQAVSLTSGLVVHICGFRVFPAEFIWI